MLTNVGNLLDWSVGNVMAIGKSYGFRTTLVFEEGNRVRQQSGFAKRREAEDARGKELARFINNRYVLHETMTVDSFYRHWLEEVKRPLLTSDSYQSYKNCVYNYILPVLGHYLLSELAEKHIEGLYRNAVLRSASTAKILKTVVTSSMKYALAEHEISRDPSENVRLPKASSHPVESSIQPETLTEEQVKRLLLASRGTALYLPIIFAVLMGLRRGEIIGLKYGDIDFRKKTIHIQRQLGKLPGNQDNPVLPKTITKQEIPLKTQNSDRILELPELIFMAIMEERHNYEKRRSRRKKEFQDLDYICCSSYGRPRGRTYFWAPFKNLLREQELPDIKWHGLRHTYATFLLKEGCGLRAVSHSLGHKKALFTADFYVDEEVLAQGLCLNEEELLNDEPDDTLFTDIVFTNEDIADLLE